MCQLWITRASECVARRMEFQGTNAEGKDTSSAVFASKRKISAPAEGAYRWVVDTVVNNNARDSSKTDSYEVHFKVDRTAPAFTLTSDAMMNPDSSMFITRFKWDGSGLSDIHAMFVWVVGEDSPPSLQPLCLVTLERSDRGHRGFRYLSLAGF